MKRAFRVVLSTLKWGAIGVVGVEVTSFLVITLANLFVYGSVWEGSRVNYDGYTLFQEGPRATTNNPPTTPGPSPEHRTIWMFGGSTMRGATDDDTKTIPSFLAGLLNAEEARTRFTVTNFGENSFNSLLETRYLQKALIEQSVRPDLVVFYDGANESVYFAQFRTPYAHHGYQQVRAIVESHRRSAFGLLKPLNAALYASFTWELFNKVNQTLIPLEADSREVHDFIERTVQRYDYVHQQADFYGADFVLFWQPVLWTEDCEVMPEVAEVEWEYAINKLRFTAVKENFRTVQQTLADALRGRPYFVDLRDALCSRTAPVYQHDGVHLQDGGREMVARAMQRLLAERGLLAR
ncbi:MAG TPA: hypothetical protein VLH75_05765 [Longimicrobiales bacterium]|nr:hypothetical protein [Longimicrobiales bacterium]